MLVKILILMSCFASVKVKGARNYDSRLLILERIVHLDMLSLNKSINELFTIVKNSGVESVNNIGDSMAALQDEINILNIIKRGFYEEKRWMRQRTEMFALILEQISQSVQSTNDELETKIDRNEKQINSLNQTFDDITNSLHSSGGKVLSSIEMLQRQTQTLATKVSSLSSQLEETTKRLRESEETNANLMYAMYHLHENNEKWRVHGKSIYYMGNEEVTWQQAKTVCENIGGYLAEITSSEEQAFLKELAKSHLSGSEPGVWLGGTDAHHEGSWIWDHSQRPLEGSKAYWKKGEPNNSKNNENCLHLYKIVDYLWNDCPCTAKMAFFCQKDVLNARQFGEFKVV